MGKGDVDPDRAQHRPSPGGASVCERERRDLSVGAVDIATVSDRHDANEVLVFVELVDHTVGAPSSRKSTLVLEHQPLAESLRVAANRFQCRKYGCGNLNREPVKPAPRGRHHL
jgi:hypothetical protein